MFTSLEDLRKKAIEVERCDRERAYCSKFEVLAFVMDGMMYAVPWSRSALRILTYSGFTRKDLRIPYVTDLVTSSKEEYWEDLVKQSYSDRPL